MYSSNARFKNVFTLSHTDKDICLQCLVHAAPVDMSSYFVSLRFLQCVCVIGEDYVQRCAPHYRRLLLQIPTGLSNLQVVAASDQHRTV